MLDFMKGAVVMCGKVHDDRPRRHSRQEERNLQPERQTRCQENQRQRLDLDRLPRADAPGQRRTGRTDGKAQ